MLRLRAEFYKASEKLADAGNDRVPDTVVTYLLFFALVMPRRDVLPRFIWHVARGRFEKRPFSPDNPIAKDLREMEQKLSDLYALAISTFILAMTYNHFLLGRIIRRFLFWGVDPHYASHRAVMAAADLARRKKLRSLRGPSGGQPFFDQAA